MPRSSLVCFAAVALLALMACSPVVEDPASNRTTSGPTSQVPSISDVAPLADPKSWTGAVELNLPDPTIEPVEADSEPTLPATVTDSQGTEVTVTDVRRILALDIYGTLSHTVFELGLGENVVGRDTSSVFPEIADLPLVTSSAHELSAEKILDLNPSVILSDTSLGPVNVLLQMRKAGIPVVMVDSHRGLDNLASLTLEVADALGVHDAGVALGQRLEEETGAVAAAVADVVPQNPRDQLRTLFLYLRGQAGVYYMFGKGSGADALITAAGGYDVATEIDWGGMKPVTDEGIIAAQPDVLLMMDGGLESVGGVDGLLDRFPALRTTPAGEHQRVVAMNDDQVLSFGPRAADVLNALAVALYAPDAL